MIIFMEGLRTGVASTKVFRVHPSTFEETVNVALNAKFNCKAGRFGNQYQISSTADPRDLSYAEDESEIHVA